MEAILKGASAVHAREVHSRAERDSLERLLIETYQPILNIQLRSG